METPAISLPAPPPKPAEPDAYAPVMGHLTTADGTRLPMRAWLPKDGKPRVVILAVHGFNDYSNAFDMPARWWAERGIATYAYDQRGFGGAPNFGYWAGTRTMDSDLGDAARLVAARYPGVPLYYLGESMGAAVIMTALARGFAPEPAGMILAAPAVWSRSFMPFYQSWALWLVGHTMPWLRFTGRGLGIQASDNIEMLRGLSHDPLVIKKTRTDTIKGLVDLMDQAMRAADKLRGPTLVLIGARDRVVPLKPQWAAAQALPNPTDQRVAYYKDGWHMLLRDLDRKLVWEDIAAWIGNHDAPLPSGADRAAETREASREKP